MELYVLECYSELFTFTFKITTVRIHLIDTALLSQWNFALVKKFYTTTLKRINIVNRKGWKGGHWCNHRGVWVEFQRVGTGLEMVVSSQGWFWWLERGSLEVKWATLNWIRLERRSQWSFWQNLLTGAVLGEEAGSRVLDIPSLLMSFQDGPLWMDAVIVLIRDQHPWWL